MIKNVILFIGHILFYTTAALVTLFFGIFSWPVFFIPGYKAAGWCSRGWTRCILKLAQLFLGISYRIEGLSHLSDAKTPCIIACTHQSAWETLMLNTLLPNPVFVLKSGLLNIPLLGAYFKKLEMIPIHRGRTVQKEFLKAAHKAVSQHRPIVIFPEGHRVPSGASVRCQQGVFWLYDQCNVCLIPATLNSGLFWKPRHFFKTPGTICLRFHEALLPGLPKETCRNVLTSVLQNGNQVLYENNASPKKEVL